LQPLAAYPGLATPVTNAAVTSALNWSGGQTCKVAFGTEAGFLSDLGIPTVVCGPGSMADQGHKPDEYISQTQLIKCSQMLARAVGQLLWSRDQSDTSRYTKSRWVTLAARKNMNLWKITTTWICGICFVAVFALHYSDTVVSLMSDNFDNTSRNTFFAIMGFH
jgi:hypothetical protein